MLHFFHFSLSDGLIVLSDVHHGFEWSVLTGTFLGWGWSEGWPWRSRDVWIFIQSNRKTDQKDIWLVRICWGLYSTYIYVLPSSFTHDCCTTAGNINWERVVITFTQPIHKIKTMFFRSRLTDDIPRVTSCWRWRRTRRSVYGGCGRKRRRISEKVRVAKTKNAARLAHKIKSLSCVSPLGCSFCLVGSFLFWWLWERLWHSTHSWCCCHGPGTCTATSCANIVIYFPSTVHSGSDWPINLAGKRNCFTAGWFFFLVF